MESAAHSASSDSTQIAATEQEETRTVSARSLHTLTVLLVRHGETASNAEGRFQGHLDIPLSPRGEEQAALLAARLHQARRRAATAAAAAAVSPFTAGFPRCIYSSDLSRASRTAQIIAGEPAAAPLYQTALLRERGFGSWEGLTAPEIHARFGDKAASPPDGESGEAVAQRMERALAQCWTESLLSGRADDVILIVGHGGSLRSLLAFALGVGTDAARGFRLDNTGLSAVRFTGTSEDIRQSEGRVILVNDTAHLQG